MSIPVRLLRDENSRIQRELAIAAAERDALDVRIAKLWKMSESLRWLIRADAGREADAPRQVVQPIRDESPLSSRGEK